MTIRKRKRLIEGKDVGEMSRSKSWPTWHVIVCCACFDSSDDDKRDRETSTGFPVWSREFSDPVALQRLNYAARGYFQPRFNEKTGL